MGKFRSKLKRHTKGKKWAHGQSATSNPENTKHRSKARSRFFQPNLSLAPETKPNSTAPLTLEALTKHDARLSYAGDKKADPTVNDIAVSLRSFNFSDDDMSESQIGTFKTFQTFASNYSSCSNMTFNKFLNGFRGTSDLHKEMLAILSAIAEVIKERNGTESSTEYFLALMETLEVAKKDNEIVATISLLAMVIKTVPCPVLRKKFSDCGTLFSNLLEQFAENENQNALRSIIGCTSVLLRAQEYSSWASAVILKLFNQILSFSLHTKPKIRKASQHAIASIIHGCCFMAPRKISESDVKETIEDNENRIHYHPAGTYVAKFCIEQFKPENITKSQTVILHALSLLRDTLNGFKGDDIKDVCENLLSIMTASKVMIQTNCFHIIHSLFSSKSPNLTSNLLGKLIAAIYDYRPEQTDVRQTLAWLTVLKEGHVCLAKFDLKMCITTLPRFVDVTAGDIWMSDNPQVVSGASNVLKELLLECVKPCCESNELVAAFGNKISRILNAISKGLTAPFGPVAQQVINVYETVFEVGGKDFKQILQGPLSTIASRYDEETTPRAKIEKTILSAIKYMGPEAVLNAIPLTDSQCNVSISRSWTLPLLREAIVNSTLEFFATYILQLANKCYDNWQKYKAENSNALAHTNELLYCQLWGLFPGFCTNPTDISKFGEVAQTLGKALESRVEIRLPILHGLQKLLNNADDECKQQLRRFAKNFLPRLLNIYSTKPTGSYENEIRTTAFEVIKEYFKVAPEDRLIELFTKAKAEFKSKERIETILDMIQKLNQSIEHDDDDNDQKIDEGESKLIQEAYDILQQLLRGENVLGDEYIKGNEEEVKEYLTIVPTKRLQNLFKHTKTSLGPFKYEAYFDIIVALALYQPATQLKELFDDYIAPTLRNVKKGGVSRLIKERGLKSYELLKNILQSENNGCVQFTKSNLKEIQKILLGSMQENKENVKVAQLTCLSILIDKEANHIQSNSKIVSKTISEIVIAFSQATNDQKENVAQTLLLTICEIYKRENKLNDLVDVLNAGFGGDTLVITNTIHVLRVIIQNYSGDLTLKTVTFVLEQVLAFVVTKNRCEVKAAVAFLLVFIKLLPAPYVANHLPDIVKSVSAMVPDTKRFLRNPIKHLLERLCKRFTPEEIIKLVPGNDEVTHKKLKNIKKELARLKRQKAAEAKTSSGDESDEDTNIEAKTTTIDDILADSDSELENDIIMDDEQKPDQRPKKKARSKDERYIHEDIDDIVDLADVNAMSKITSTKPVKKTGESNIVKKKTKDPNRGFKVSEDGRFIIEEPKRGGNIDDSDSDDNDDEDDNQQLMDDSDSDGNEANEAKNISRKRKATNSLSVASGKSGTSSKYVAGGKGIHREVGAASVRSGVSRASSKATTANLGADYRSKKAQGDIKKKGTFDPYAYIPLSRSSLNKRKRAKSGGQFKNIVTGARKGAAAGTRNKKRKTE